MRVVIISPQHLTDKWVGFLWLLLVIGLGAQAIWWRIRDARRKAANPDEAEAALPPEAEPLPVTVPQPPASSWPQRLRHFGLVLVYASIFVAFVICSFLALHRVGIDAYWQVINGIIAMFLFLLIETFFRPVQRLFRIKIPEFGGLVPCMALFIYFFIPYFVDIPNARAHRFEQVSGPATGVQMDYGGRNNHKDFTIKRTQFALYSDYNLLQEGHVYTVEFLRNSGHLVRITDHTPGNPAALPITLPDPQPNH